jgi:radical SAM superfamily enzyme YgiQ (UPF0313 family)
MKKKILLMLLPFWPPFIPPMGIASLKGYLNRYNIYDIKNYDLNVNPKFLMIQDNYLNHLKIILPEDKIGNINTDGKDILMYHSLAYLNRNEGKTYFNSLNELFYKTFYIDIDFPELRALDNFISEYYLQLEISLKEVIMSFIPDVLGLSVFDSNLGSSLFAVKIAKDISSDILTFMGGGIFSNQLHPEAYNFNNVIGKMGHLIDKIVIGEGEILFHSILSGKIDSKKKIYTISDINHETVDIAKSGIPDFIDFQLDRYAQLPHFTSRSCPFHCAFCTEPQQWGNYRKKDVSQIASEFIELSEKYDTGSFFLCDSLVDPLITDLSNEMISRDSDIYWDGFLRVSNMSSNIQNTLLWRSGGFYRARLGIESGSDNILKRMNKNINTKQIIDTIKSLAYAGIKTTTYWIAGFPDETEDDFQKTLDLVRELKDDIYSAECHAYAHYPKGQIHTEKWTDLVKSRFSKDLENLTMIQAWDLNISPSHEEILTRLNRFLMCCKECGISNPYNYSEWQIADERWSRLHENAVPQLLELKKPKERRNKKEIISSVKINETLRIDNNFNY